MKKRYALILIPILYGIIQAQEGVNYFNGMMSRIEDKAVNNLFIDEIVKTVFGDSVIIVETPTNPLFPHCNFINNDSTQLLKAIVHPGAYMWMFSEFTIKYLDKDLNEPCQVADTIKEFKTYKGIKLGITRDELRNILGQEIQVVKNDEKEILEYNMKPYAEQLEKIDLLIYTYYYGKYTFINDELVEINFGHEYY